MLNLVFFSKYKIHKDIKHLLELATFTNAMDSQIRILNLANQMKKQNKKHQNARFINEKLNYLLNFFMSFARLIIVICAFGASFL